MPFDDVKTLEEEQKIAIENEINKNIGGGNE
jgi:hypothetical protein